MATARLSVNLAAIQRNWKSLHAVSGESTQTAAVVKADGYGLDAAQVAAALTAVGASTFFVAAAEEGAAVRQVVADATIYVFSGYMQNDAGLYANHNLIPLLNSPQQLQAWQTNHAGKAFGLQLDTGMNRLGFEPDEFNAIGSHAGQSCLLISHLACADQPEHPLNAQQLECFHQLTDPWAASGIARSLAATGGTLLGPDFHFDMVRPGIGLYGGLPYNNAEAVVTLALPIIQTRKVLAGETVGYGAAWQADHTTIVATLAAGYADGIIRAIGAGAGPNDKPISVYAGKTACPVIGRISMDLLTVDISALDLSARSEYPVELELLNALQGIDTLAAAASTIGYEVLTACGNRYQRQYLYD